MKRSLVSKITGVPVQETVYKPLSVLRRVLGEEEASPADPAPAEHVDVPEEPAEAPAERNAELEMAAADEETPVSGNVATGLARAWRSGGKVDVAMRLLSEPISYRDYTQLIFDIGVEDALELGGLLDELADQYSPTESEEPAPRPGRHPMDTPAEEEADFRERHAEGDVDAINQAEQ